MTARRHLTKWRTTCRPMLCLLGLAIAAIFCDGQTATIRDIATNALDPANLADTEPSIFVNPANTNQIAVVAFSGAWSATTNAPVWVSNNGGVTWTKPAQIPQPPALASGALLAGPNDQKNAFNATGNLFVAELGSAGTTNQDFVYRQAGAPGAALTAGAAYGDDQPHLAIDITAASPCFGTVYSPWLNTTVTPNRSTVSSSNNGGVTVNAVAVSNSTVSNRTTRIALAPTGQAYVIFKTREGAVSGVSLPGSTSSDFENAHFRVQRSDDCGQNWNALGAAGVSVHGANAVQTFFTTNFGVTGTGRKNGRARSSDAWIAVAPNTGDVYAVFANRDTSGFGQIFVARSQDRGVNWTSTRVTDGTRHSAYPEVAVAANGAIGVLYVDFTDTGTATLFRHMFARSFDNGQTWNRQILQTMDPAPITNAANGFLWGDYEGLTAAGNRFYGVFTGASIGRTGAGGVPTIEFDPIFFTDTATPARLDIVKEVLPPGDPGRFNLQIDGAIITTTPKGGGSTGPQIVAAGTHTVGETAGPGTSMASYVTMIGAGCAANGSITLADGDTKGCTITNLAKSGVPACEAECAADRDSCMSEVGQPGAPLASQCANAFQRCKNGCVRQSHPPRLTVIKQLLPVGDPGRFNLQIDGVTQASNVGNGGSTGAKTVSVGFHTASETAATGTNAAQYSTVIGGDCAANGSVPVAGGEDKTCFITNTGPPPSPQLTVTKALDPPVDPGVFNLRIDGVTQASNVGDGGSTGPKTLSPGVHTVSEAAGTGTSLTQYTTAIGGDCAANGTITLAPGDNKSCVIMNTAKPTRAACLAECVADRNFCMTEVGQPGAPLASQCATAFQACKRACH